MKITIIVAMLGAIIMANESGAQDQRNEPVSTIKGADASGWKAAAMDVPVHAANDAVMARPADVAEATAWASAAFGGNPLPARESPNLDLLFAGRQLPFSFVYDGKASADLLKTWPRKLETNDRADRVLHTVQWADEKSGLHVTAVVTCFKRYPAVEWVLYFENQGRQDTPIIENIQVLDAPLSTATRPVVLHRIAGDNCTPRAFEPLETELKVGQSVRLAPGGGRSSNGTFPFFNVASGDQGLFAAIGWSGQWAASLNRAANGATRLSAGMERTRLLLHPGEKIRSPRILLMAWQGDRMVAHNRFRRLMIFHYSPKLDGRPVLIPAFLQCFDRYNGNPNWRSEAGQIDSARVAKAVGCEFLWLDAAWFPGGFPNGVGNWSTHEGFPKGLKPVSDACHEMGLKFTAWFEPERVARGSQIANEHPEFVHGGGNGGLFKLDDPAARRWLTDLLNRRIKEYGLDWYRNDFNMDPLGFWRENDAPDRQGMTEIRYIEGLYAMWDEMIAKRPGLVIDNCASGGRRIDLETCMRSLALWQSDINCRQGAEDAHQAQNVCLSLYIPLHTSCAWHATAYELRSTVTAGLVVQFPILDPGFSAEKARPLVEEMKSYRKFWYGDIYPLTSLSPAQDRQMAVELYRPDLREGIVMCFRRAKCAEEELTLTLKGLDPEKKYWVWSEEGFVPPSRQAGQNLMKPGIVVRLPFPRVSDVISFRDAALGKPSGLESPPDAFRLKDAKIRSNQFTVDAELAWEPANGARRYRVLISEAKDFDKVTAERNVWEPSVQVTGLPPGKRLFWKVEASSRGGTQTNAGGAGSLRTPELANMKGIVFASDMKWTKATVGADNPVRRDVNLKEAPIMIAGKRIQKGLWTHAFKDNRPADIVFDIAGRKFGTFKATVGLDDLGEKGSVRFQVLVDGEKKTETPILRHKQSQPITVDVTGAGQITLRVLNGGDGHGWDQAVWGFARFIETGSKDAWE